MRRVASRTRRAGFVLLEALLAVAIFAVGVIGLGRCVSNCISAEQLQAEDALARRVLENRLAEIESGAVPISPTQIENLSEPFAGMTLKQTAEPLERKNELGQALGNLYAVTVEVRWTGRRFTQNVRSLVTYVSPRE